MAKLVLNKDKCVQIYLININNIIIVILKYQIFSMVFTLYIYYNHPLKCVQWPVLLGGALGRMFGGSSNFLLTFDSKSMYMAYVLTISW